MFGLITVISTAYSAYAGWRAHSEMKKAHSRRTELLGELADVKVDYVPMSEEELTAIIEYTNAKFDAELIEKSSEYAEQMASAGYDPQQAMAQMRSRLEPQRQTMLTNLVAQLKAQDNVAERQHIMNEEMRVLENKIALASQPTPEEMGISTWSRQADVASQVAGLAGQMWAEQPPKDPDTQTSWRGRMIQDSYADSIDRRYLPDPSGDTVAGVLRESFGQPQAMPTAGYNPYTGLTPEQLQDLQQRAYEQSRQALMRRGM